MFRRSHGCCRRFRWKPHPEVGSQRLIALILSRTNVPSIILPQAQWNSPVGEIDIPGLASLTQGMPAQGMAYPDVMGENEQFVTSTGIL
jgi:hypothetical protein